MEFCSNGDLRTYLMARREEFQLSFLASTMKEFNNDKNALSDDKSLNVSRLLLWAYQVTHVIPNSIDDIIFASVNVF